MGKKKNHFMVFGTAISFIVFIYNHSKTIKFIVLDLYIPFIIADSKLYDL